MCVVTHVFGKKKDIVHKCHNNNIINGVRQGRVWSSQLFAIYMDDLSVCLTQCKAGCHLNETVTNHVMYADDICLMAPSIISLPKILTLCYEFSQSNGIMFNSIKSQCK